MNRKVIVACLLAAVGLSGCWLPGHAIGVEMRNKPRFESEWRDYCELQGFKALALAGDFEGVYVFGFADEASDQETATAEAMRHCEQRRLDRRISAPCQVYFVGECPPPEP